MAGAAAFFGRRAYRQTVPCRVLVIDTYPDTAEIMADALSVFGHECIATFDIDEALRSLGTFLPNVIILEWAARDGQDAGVIPTVSARAAELRIQPLIIVVSAERASKRFAHQQLVHGYFQKPASAAALNDLIMAAAPPLRHRDN